LAFRISAVDCGGRSKGAQYFNFHIEIFHMKAAITFDLQAPIVDPGSVLAKAVGRAGSMLGLSGAALARVIGLSEPTVSRLLRGEHRVNPASKPGELAALLVRVYRSLDALVGNDQALRIQWMTSFNRDLGGVPRDLIASAQGLVNTLAYLDGMRAPI
jgi:transcriptional regulator with XRE-family HTH domain